MWICEVYFYSSVYESAGVEKRGGEKNSYEYVQVEYADSVTVFA